MADLILMGAQYQGVPAVDLPKQGGGLARFYEDNVIGKCAELVRTVFEDETALEDTLFNGWTPSTTAKAIIATANATTEVLDLANYEYVLKWETSIEVALNEGATTKAQLKWEGADQYQHIRKYPSSLANIRAENFNGNACTTYFTVPFMRYWNTSGTLTYTHSISYGIYPALTAATFSNSTSNTPTLTIKTPTVNARCNATYFATARAAEVDQANTVIKRVGKLYRVAIPNAVREMYADFYERALDEGALA